MFGSFRNNKSFGRIKCYFSTKIFNKIERVNSSTKTSDDCGIEIIFKSEEKENLSNGNTKIEGVPISDDNREETDIISRDESSERSSEEPRKEELREIYVDYKQGLTLDEMVYEVNRYGGDDKDSCVEAINGSTCGISLVTVLELEITEWYNDNCCVQAT